MNEPGIDDEVLQDYLAECREHLATIETDLLAIEQGGAEIDEQLVNRVFRAAHSIKGGAGFFDLTKIRELAHKTENALDLVRCRQMVPTPEVVSILLLAFDKLRVLIGNHQDSNYADIGEFVVALTSLAAGSLPASEKSSLSEQVSVQLPDANKHIQVSAFDLSQARKGGKFVYLIEYDLIHDIERRNLTPWEVFKSLIKCGTILETVFDLDSAGTLEDEPSNKLMLEVLYATVLEPELLQELTRGTPGTSAPDREERRLHSAGWSGFGRGCRAGGSGIAGYPSTCADRANRGGGQHTQTSGRSPGSGRRDHHPAEREPARFADDAGRRTGAQPQPVE